MAQNAAAAMDTAGNVGGITPDGVYFIRDGKLTYYRYDELGGGGGSAEFPPGGNIGDVLVKTGEDVDAVGWSAPSGIAMYPITGSMSSDRKKVTFSVPSGLVSNIIFGIVNMSSGGGLSVSQPIFNFSSPIDYPLIEYDGNSYLFVPSFQDGTITLQCKSQYNINSGLSSLDPSFPSNAIFTLYLAVKESVASATLSTGSGVSVNSIRVQTIASSVTSVTIKVPQAIAQAALMYHILIEDDDTGNITSIGPITDDTLDKNYSAGSGTVLLYNHGIISGDQYTYTVEGPNMNAAAVTLVVIGG